MTLGEKIRRTRLQKGLTQAQLAGDCITRNMLSQIEHDAAKPSMRTLEHIARTLEVKMGWLLEKTELDRDNALQEARDRYQEKDYVNCLEQLQRQSGPTQEGILLTALCVGELAQVCLDREEYGPAEDYARQALAACDQCLYPTWNVQALAASVLVVCRMAADQEAETAVADLRDRYLRGQTAVGCHLLMAHYHLGQQHVQAAEREIWSIADLPEENRAEYLILRGHIANQKEQFENAALYFQQAEESQPSSKRLLRLLYQGMERCCKELEQYKLAYEYAVKQKEL